MMMRNRLLLRSIGRYGLIWQNGEKALTKALVASKLYRSMVSESA